MKTIELTTGARAGHNAPALSHETYAKQAVSSLRAGVKSAIKGSHNVIEALLIADQNGIVDNITELHTKRGREFDTNAIMADIFGLRAKRDDGSYYVVGGLTELAREYEGLEMPEGRRIKAQENDKVENALRMQVKRNLAVVAMLAEAGGAYHESEHPQGAAFIDEKEGLLQVRAAVWFDDAEADGWILLNGTKPNGGPSHTLTALQAAARKRFGQVGPGRPKGSHTENILRANINYLHGVVLGESAMTEEAYQQVRSKILPDVLTICMLKENSLDAFLDALPRLDASPESLARLRQALDKLEGRTGNDEPSTPFARMRRRR